MLLTMSPNIFTLLNTIKILFFLVINDLKGYFKYSKENDKKELEFIMEDLFIGLIMIDFIRKFI